DAHAAADQHAEQENRHRHHGGGHEEKHQLLAVQLDLVEAVVLNLVSHVRPIVALINESYKRVEAVDSARRSRDPQRPSSRASSCFASVDDGSSASARSASVRAAARSFDWRYASPSSACVSAVSALHSAIFNAPIASAMRPLRR